MMDKTAAGKPEAAIGKPEIAVRKPEAAKIIDRLHKYEIIEPSPDGKGTCIVLSVCKYAPSN